MNDLVKRDDSSSNGNLGITGSGLGERLYAQQDANWNVTSVTTSTGAVAERFEYDRYGTRSSLTAGFGSISYDSYNVDVGFQGGVTLNTPYGLPAMIQFHYRIYNSAYGRWLTADPWGYVNGPNRYQLEEGNPVERADPQGTDASLTVAKVVTPTADVAVTGLEVSSAAVGAFLWVFFSPASNGRIAEGGHSEAWEEEHMRDPDPKTDWSETDTSSGGDFGDPVPPVPLPPKRPRGFIVYQPLDPCNRATGAYGLITDDMIGTGTKAGIGAPNPSGYATSPSMSRGHLIGRQFGGDGKDSRNLVPLDTRANNEDMAAVENSLAALIIIGDDEFLMVFPHYDGCNPIPKSIEMMWFGTFGDTGDVNIPNPAYKPTH